MLPDFQVSDPRAGKWKPEHGWLGLIPDRSTLSDAMLILGPAIEHRDLANAKEFVFKEGLIRITILEDQPCITSIWVSGKCKEEGFIPADLDSARRLFEGLKPRRIEKLGGVVFETRGVRLACTPIDDPRRLEWMEIYRPQD